MDKALKKKSFSVRNIGIIAVIACLIVVSMVPMGAFGAEADYTISFVVDGDETRVGIFAIAKENEPEETTDEAIAIKDDLDENGNKILEGYLQADAIPDLEEGWKWQDEESSSLYTENDLLDMVIERSMTFTAVDPNAAVAEDDTKVDGKSVKLNELDNDDFIKTNVSWSRTNESSVKTLKSKFDWKISDVGYLAENMMTNTADVWDAANHGDTKLIGGNYHYYSTYLPEKTYTPWNAATWKCKHGENDYTKADMRLFRGKFELDDGITSVDNFKLDTVTGDNKIQINDNMFVFVYPDADNFKLTDSNFTDQLAFWVVGATSSLDANTSAPADFYGIRSNITTREHAYRVGDKSYIPVPSQGALSSLKDGLYLSDGVYLKVSNNNIATPIKVASEYKNYKNWIIDIYVQDVWGGGGMDQMYVSMSGGNDDPGLILKYWVVDEDGNWTEANADGQSYHEVTGLTKSDIGKPYTVGAGNDAGQLDMHKPDGYNTGVQNNPEYNIVEGNNVINILYTKKTEAPSMNTVQFKSGENGIISGDNDYGEFMTGTPWEKTCWVDFDNIPVPKADEGYVFAGWKDQEGNFVEKNNERQYKWPVSIDKDYIFTAVFDVDENYIPDPTPGTTVDDNDDTDGTGTTADKPSDSTTETPLDPATNPTENTPSDISPDSNSGSGDETLNMTTDKDPETALGSTSTANPANSTDSSGTTGTPGSENTSVVDNILRTLGEISAPLSGGSDNDVVIKDNQIAQSGYGSGAAAWALLNLILTILTGIIAIALLVTWFTKKKEDEEESQNRIADENNEETKVKKKPVLRMLSVVMTILAAVLFILTEDMSLPMIFKDNYTIYHIVIFLITVLLAVFSVKQYEKPEQDPEYA